jgi:hypothetical protein
MSPYAVALPYEPLRFAEYLHNVPMLGPSSTWVMHSGNAAEASGIGEGASKPDIQPSLTVSQVKPQKLCRRLLPELGTLAGYRDLRAG